MPFHQQTLANGLTILGETNPAALSVAVAFWVRTGSRDEQPAESGVSHFLEHMIFKGTERRNAYEVNRDFSVIGADNNAWTSEENTVYHAVVLPEFLPQLVDVLADIMRPSLRVEDFDTEKKVILDEIVRYEVQPGWASFDIARKNYFGNHPLGNSVLGTSESIMALKQTQMLDYYQRRYGASNIVAVATGKFDFGEFSKLVREKCEHWPVGVTGRSNIRETKGQGGMHMIAKPREKVSQQYMTMVAPAPAANSPLSYASSVLATAVGDYSGSRIFWALTDPGLADEAGMGIDECDGAGAYYTSFNGDPENAPQCYAIMQELLEEVQRDGLTAAEFEQAKTKILSRELRAGERSSRRMLTVAKDWVYRDTYRTVDDEMKAWDAVKLQDIRTVLEAYPLTNQTVTGYGPLESIGE